MVKNTLIWIWAVGFYTSGITILIGAIWIIFVIIMGILGKCPPGAECPIFSRTPN